MNIPTSQTPPMNVTLIALVAGALIAGAAGGFFGARYFMQADEFVPEEAGYVKTEELPLQLDVLQNPVVLIWQVSASGTLVAKSEDSFTLEKDGHTLDISVHPTITIFYEQDIPVIDGVRQPRIERSLSEIQLGTFLYGEIQMLSARGSLKAGVEEFRANAFIIDESRSE